MDDEDVRRKKVLIGKQTRKIEEEMEGEEIASPRANRIGTNWSRSNAPSPCCARDFGLVRDLPSPS
jgi:hypothetical protein